MNDTLFRRVQSLNVKVLHACEVGVFLPHTSNLLGFINEGVRTTLVEADPDIVGVLHSTFGHSHHVRIVPYAVYSERRMLEFCRAGSSTFAAELGDSPAISNDSYNKATAERFVVQAVRFDEIDDGTIDVLSIDTEGCDWFVVKYMKSRPLVISIETGVKRYRNPYRPEIQAWMKENGYALWYRDRSDSVFISREFAPQTLRHRLARLFQL